VTASFRGFGPGLYEFFEGLSAHNERAWFAEHKAQYESQVREPLEALFDDLEPEFGPARIFRIHRDVRFSKDKTPYKTSQAGLIDRGNGATRYLQVGADGVMIGVGAPHFDREQLSRFRRAVGGDDGEELAEVLAGLRRRRYDVGTLGPDGITSTGELKRVPSGFPPDHPRADLLRYKSLIAAVSFDRPTWLGSSKAVAEVTTRWRLMQPLADWLERAVGPAAPRDATTRR
jgi:uncharacterized protein (TIGR02453 family)